MFSNDDEDGDFLSPTGGAKLASLFGLDQAASQGNQSFQYTAPKQPRRNSANAGPPTQKPAPPPGAPAVLLATPVHAYRFINGQYMKQGKLGAAVLGNHTTKEYKLLLYANQQKQVTAARIHLGFTFTVQPSNYCVFYDDQRQTWSVMFESEKAAEDFCKEICIAKANSAPVLDAVVVQDLVLGEEQGVESGDLVEVAYTGWLLQNHTIGSMFDSNLNKEKLLKVKLGAGKVIKGWEEGMLNMRKGGRRLLVVPPSLAYGGQGVPNRVPPDSTLLFQTEIRRVKFIKDGGAERVSLGWRDSAAPSPVPSIESGGGPEPPAQPPTAGLVHPKPADPPPRAKPGTLGEQQANSEVTKAMLISRMARMGQPMPFLAPPSSSSQPMPFLAPPSSSSQADSSDSELEDPSVSRLREHATAPSPQPVTMTAAPPVPSQAALMPVTIATATPHPIIPSAVHGFQPAGQIYPTQTVAYHGPGDVTSFLMTEARQHNTEIRLAVGKVADKVDNLSSKVEELQKHGGLALGLSGVSMETGMIMHNIQRIIQENECLKKEVFEKNSRIEEQNRKIGDLINQNQRYLEQSNLLMEQRTDSMKSSSEQSQARLLQAEQEKHALLQDVGGDQVRLVEELSLSVSRVAELQLELTAQQQRSTAQHTHTTTLLAQHQELEEAVDQAKAQYRTEKQKRKEVELKLNTQEEELQDLKTEKENLERTLADKKRRWQTERRRCDEELEEARRACQQEIDSVRSQLQKARTSSDPVSPEQQEGHTHCDAALAAAREQHSRSTSQLTQHRDSLQRQLSQQQEQLLALKQTRDTEEQLLRQQEQGEELQALQEKYAEAERSVALLREQHEQRVAELERRLAEQQEHTHAAGEVKRVMNGVFQSLRGEFDLNQTYTGRDVIGTLVNTIKNVTLQLLTETQGRGSEHGGEEEEVEEAQRNTQTLGQENGKREGEREEREEEQEVPKSAATGEKGKREEQTDVVDTEEKESVREEQTDVVETEEKESVREEQTDVMETEEKESVREEQTDVVDTEKKESVREEQTDVMETEEKESVREEQTDVVDTEEHMTENAGEEMQQEVMHDNERAEHGVDLETQEMHHQAAVSQRKTRTQGNAAETDSQSETPAEHDITGQQAEAPVAAADIISTSEEKGVSENIDPPGADPIWTKPKPSGPPNNPPPPPEPLHAEPSPETHPPTSSRIESLKRENGEEPLFQSAAPTKRPPSEDEEEEVSLKGRPPPAPLFGDDDEDDDLDWLG